jgi:hypothetical protein
MVLVLSLVVDTDSVRSSLFLFGLAYCIFHTGKKDDLLDLAEPLVLSRIEESHDRILRSS